MYGVIPRADTPPRNRPQEPEPQVHRRVSLSDPRVAQPSLQRSYLVPSYRTAKPGEAEALDVLAQVLGGGQTGRLYRELVAEQGLAAGAGAWYQSTAYDETRFGISASPRPGVTLETLEQAMDGVVAKMAKDGPDDVELARAKTRLTAEAIYARDNQATLARIYGAAWATGISVEDVNRWPDLIKRVTAADVKAAAAHYLVLKRAVTGYLTPPPAAAPAAPEKRS
ncbi:MAG: hypothetical protein B7X76_10320 [Azorhizobium sp. 39-67-5]|nr:MAG: hypothetical protein B7X76_10320 [Azorhizobium sp. 39-67-5]